MKAQFPAFSPFVLTNSSADGSKTFLAFPSDEGKSVLYWLGVAYAYKTKSDLRGLEVKNVETQTDLKIQFVTNTLTLSKSHIEGKIIGAIVGSLVLGIATGIVLSDIRNPNNGLYLGLGGILGGGIFGVGFVIDFGENIKKKSDL